MSATGSILLEDASINSVRIRKPLVFPDGTTQTTAYTGDNVVTLQEALTAGNSAGGLNISNVGTLTANAVQTPSLQVSTQIQLTPSGNTANFVGEINQVAIGNAFDGNQLQSTMVYNGATGPSNQPSLVATDNVGNDGIGLLPNCLDNGFNPIVQEGDMAVVGNSVSQSFTLTKTSASATCGVRMTDTSLMLGAGGTADVPSNVMYFNDPSGAIRVTTEQGMYVTSAGIEPTPTFALRDTVTNQSMYFLPSANGGNYNPIALEGNQQIVATSGVVDTQSIDIIPFSTTTSGVRVAPTSVVIGAGGTTATPAQSVDCNGTPDTLTLRYTNLAIQTAGALPTTGGDPSGKFLQLTVDGTVYKLLLLNP